jgi:hypothetical protein
MNQKGHPKLKGALVLLGVLLAFLLTTSSCTKQIDGSLRFLQQEQAFSSAIAVNTKIDMLWIVDNSSSMDVSQEKLRQGFSAFATRYLKPTWDIRSAVITSDTFLAHTGFQNYINSDLGAAGTLAGQSNPYIASRRSTFVNTALIGSLVNTTTGAFTRNMKVRDLAPLWGPNYARLQNGIHDGPTTGFCVDFMSYFYLGVTDCRRRDLATLPTTTESCLNPNTAAGETSMNQCVNTVQNNSVRSGRTIIETMPPTGTLADSSWTEGLIRAFTLNITTGSAGHGSERALGSVLQLLSDNESTSTALFRPQSLRVLVFVGDEDDQTMEIPSAPPASFNPWSYYKCDQASLIALNGSSNITGPNNFYCCTGANCRYGQEGTSCPSKTVEGLTYTPSLCPREDKLRSIASIKSTIDSFFKTLDGGDSSYVQNYFIASIVPTSAATILSLQTDRSAMDASVGAIKTHAVDRADRILALGSLVGNGSLSLDIGEADYSPLLTAIGNSIVEKKGTFLLDRPATRAEDMILWVRHSDGALSEVPRSFWTVSGNTVRITDVDYILGLEATDQIIINYQPSTPG